MIRNLYFVTVMVMCFLCSFNKDDTISAIYKVGFFILTAMWNEGNKWK